MLNDLAEAIRRWTEKKEKSKVSAKTARRERHLHLLLQLSTMRTWSKKTNKRLTAFSADFGGKCGIYGMCDTEPSEGERLVRQLWHYTSFYRGKKQAKQVQRCACSRSFF